MILITIMITIMILITSFFGTYRFYGLSVNNNNINGLQRKYEICANPCALLAGSQLRQVSLEIQLYLREVLLQLLYPGVYFPF